MARQENEPLEGRNLMLYINTAETNETRFLADQHRPGRGGG